MNNKYWDKTLSLVEGCSPVSEGCENCWSAAQTHMRARQSNPKIQNRYKGLITDTGAFNGKIRLMWRDMNKPLLVKKPTVWAAWNDLFSEVPYDFIDDFLEVVEACRQHTFLVLTKRSESIVEKLFKNSPGCPCRVLGYGDYFKNLHIGVTVEKQEYHHRIVNLLNSWAGPKYISVEPMLGVINLKLDWMPIDQVICGGESGPNARPLNLNWVRNLRDQCIEHHIPFFFKQTSGFRPEKMPELDGKIWNQLVWRSND